MKLTSAKKQNKKPENRSNLFLNIDRLIPTNRADKHLKNLRNLKGKKITIEVQSLYDQVSNQMVINEYISGRVLYVDTYGIMLEDTVRKKYVNNKYQGDLHAPSKNCIVYHKIIRYIYINDSVPIFKDEAKQDSND